MSVLARYSSKSLCVNITCCDNLIENYGWVWMVKPLKFFLNFFFFAEKVNANRLTVKVNYQQKNLSNNFILSNYGCLCHQKKWKTNCAVAV